MSSFSFYYRSNKETSNLSIRFIHKKLDYVQSTPFVSNRSYWIIKTTKNGKPTTKHKKVEELKGDSNLKLHKLKLIEFKEQLETQFIHDLANGVPTTKEWLRDAIKRNHIIIEGVINTNKAQEDITNKKKKEEENKKRNLLETAIKDIFIKYESNTGELKKFKTTFSWITRYQDYTNTIYKIADFNQLFVDGFKNWADSKMGYRVTTTVGHLKRLKRAIEYVYNNDDKDIIVIHKQLRNLKFTSAYEQKNKDKIVTTLNFNELDKIDKIDFSDDEKLRETQKTILIGCETGLRFSDFNKLIDDNLKTTKDNIKFWEFKTSKTKKWVQITLTERLKYFIEKYGLPKTNFIENDDIKLNKLIKQVCRRAGINNIVPGDLSISEKLEEKKHKRRLVRGEYAKHKLITTRSFRRSFATNYYGKIDTALIIMVTGHTTENMLREYININDDRTVSRGYNTINEFHSKRNNNTKLKKVD